MSNNRNTPNQQDLKLDVSSEVANGTYSNLAIISHSPSEIIRPNASRHSQRHYPFTRHHEPHARQTPVGCTQRQPPKVRKQLRSHCRPSADKKHRYRTVRHPRQSLIGIAKIPPKSHGNTKPWLFLCCKLTSSIVIHTNYFSEKPQKKQKQAFYRVVIIS